VRVTQSAYLGMTIRSRRETITFQHPFRIRGIDRLLPPGAYEVITDEEMIEGLSFPAYRRVATMIMVPAGGSAMEMVSIGSVDLSDAQRIDASMPRE
jgi:hypothetical protein